MSDVVLFVAPVVQHLLETPIHLFLLLIYPPEDKSFKYKVILSFMENSFHLFGWLLLQLHICVNTCVMHTYIGKSISILGYQNIYIRILQFQYEIKSRLFSWSLHYSFLKQSYYYRTLKTINDFVYTLHRSRYFMFLHFCFSRS